MRPLVRREIEKHFEDFGCVISGEKVQKRADMKPGV
jgi:hypothetical protein